ncbi:MAG TPA: aminoglycoside phosphotransferase family protein [Candidatus Dormibacteraeota bacterium]
MTGATAAPPPALPLAGVDGPELPMLDALLDDPDLRLLALGFSKDPNAKTVVLAFPAHARRPVYAAKLASTEGSLLALRTEAAALYAINRGALGKIEATVPAILGWTSWHGRTGLVMAALPGTPMLSAYHRWHHTAGRVLVGADFALAGDWLAALQDATAGRRARVDMESAVVDILPRRFPERGAGREAAQRLRAIGRRLRRASTPRTTVHGDLWPGNILQQAGRVTGVVDWELGQAEGEPVRDLVHFALSYALFLDRHTRPGRVVTGHPGLRSGRWGDGIVYALGGRGWFPDLVEGFIRSGLYRLGADPEAWRSAALAGVAEGAATADQPAFAAENLRLFLRLTATDQTP